MPSFASGSRPHTPPWELIWDRPNPRAPRRAARPLVRLQGRAALRGSLDGGVGVEHAAHAAPRGAPAPQHRRRHRGAQRASASAWPAPRPADALPPRSICAWPRSSSTTTSAAISRCAAACAKSTATSKTGAAGPGPTPSTARSPGAATTSSGPSMRRPSPMTRKATACTRCSPTTAASRPPQVLEAHKGQPTIEKRFEQIKTVHEIAPVFLKNEGRIEALFTLYFLALLVQALIERELRLAMKRERSWSCRSTPNSAPAGDRPPSRSCAYSASGPVAVRCLVESLDRGYALNVLEDGPLQVGLGKIGACDVCAGQIGARTALLGTSWRRSSLLH